MIDSTVDPAPLLRSFTRLVYANLSEEDLNFYIKTFTITNENMYANYLSTGVSDIVQYFIAETSPVTRASVLKQITKDAQVLLDDYESLLSLDYLLGKNPKKRLLYDEIVDLSIEQENSYDSKLNELCIELFNNFSFNDPAEIETCKAGLNFSKEKNIDPSLYLLLANKEKNLDHKALKMETLADLLKNKARDYFLGFYKSLSNLYNFNNQTPKLKYLDYIDLVRDEKLDLKSFTKFFQQLALSDLSSEQRKDYIKIYVDKVAGFGSCSENFDDMLDRLIRNGVDKDDFAEDLTMIIKFDQFIQKHQPDAKKSNNDSCNNLARAIQVSRNHLSSTGIALRNFFKALDDGLIRDIIDLDENLQHVLVLAYEEANRRGMESLRQVLWRFLQNNVAPSLNLPIGKLDLMSNQAREIYDFGLDVFHGFEALTQSSRPIRGIDQPTQPLLERSLSHFAKDSFRLNCSKEKHMDLKFPGISWHFENLKIPEIQKQYLQALPAEDLEKVGIRTNNFDDLEATDVTVMRGGMILSNPNLRFFTYGGDSVPYSLILYNDHFDNPSNTVMLALPTKDIKEKIDAAKVRLADYQGYDAQLPDILDAGLDAVTLSKHINCVSPIGAYTIAQGFGERNNTHERTYGELRSYKEIWHKLQLAMSLHDKGYVDAQSFDLKQVREELQEGFNFSDLGLNEVLSWREWYLQTGSDVGTPVFIDDNPFRFSDAKNWSFKVDPAGKDGIELSIKEDNGDIRTEVLEDPHPGDRENYLNELKTTWGAEIFARIINDPLTKALRSYNRKQVEEIKNDND